MTDPSSDSDRTVSPSSDSGLALPQTQPLKSDQLPSPIELICSGRFELGELIGQGGMGRVYRARDTHLDRFVALKMLPETASQSNAAREQFLREARALAKFDSPRVVTIFSVEEVDGAACLVMPLLKGPDPRGSPQGWPFPAA